MLQEFHLYLTLNFFVLHATSAALLDGLTTTPEKLQEKGELLQFWRVLAACAAPSGTNDGRRVDLLGSRVVEAPRDGAALLKVGLDAHGRHGLNPGGNAPMMPLRCDGPVPCFPHRSSGRRLLSLLQRPMTPSAATCSRHLSRSPILGHFR